MRHEQSSRGLPGFEAAVTIISIAFPVAVLSMTAVACGGPPLDARDPSAGAATDSTGAESSSSKTPGSAPAAADLERDRASILRQELGEEPAPKGPCPERTEPDVLDNPRAPVQRTALGLAYCILQDGPPGNTVPGPNDTVRVHYTGWTIDGKMFDSSVERGQPLDLPVSGVIRGWTEGLRLMTAGDKARLWIPGNLGYGRREPGAEAGSPPKGTLIFDVELIDVIRAPSEEPQAPAEATETEEDDGKPRLVPRPLPPPASVSQ